MSELECKVCHAVIPPDAKYCENCEVGFAVANEKYSERYSEKLQQQSLDDYQDYTDAMNYLGEKL